ncbi:MAG: glycosyltransferase family 4 protein, partial [Vicinamibacterales bacterium]
MHLLISLLNFRPGRIGGTETYLRKLIPELIRRRDGNRVTLLPCREHAVEFDAAGANVDIVPFDEQSITRARILESVTPYRALAIEQRISQLNADVLLFPQQSIFPKRVTGRTVLVIHDLQYLDNPGNFSLADRIFRSGIYPYSIRRSDHIMTVSGCTCSALHRHYKLARSCVSVVQSGFDEPRITSTDDAVRIPGPYAFYPAVTLPHKNHLQLLESIAVLRGQNRFPYYLVLSGQKTSHWSTLQRTIRQRKLDNVVHCGFVAYAKVQALYRGAELILFPSLFEGFGLPVMEAVAWSKKILVSKLDIFEELGVPAANQIDFGDPEQLADAIADTRPTILTKA